MFLLVFGCLFFCFTFYDLQFTIYNLRFTIYDLGLWSFYFLERNKKWKKLC